VRPGDLGALILVFGGDNAGKPLLEPCLVGVFQVNRGKLNSKVNLFGDIVGKHPVNDWSGAYKGGNNYPIEKKDEQNGHHEKKETDLESENRGKRSIAPPCHLKGRNG